jgi:S-adenosylmethionine uptake transporter
MLPSASVRLRGITLMVMGCGAFTASDAAMKLIVSDRPVAQAIFLRCVIVLFALFVFQRRRIFSGIGRETPWKGQILCAGLWALSVTCFVISIKYLTLAVAVTLVYAGPLFVVLTAPFILDERLTRRKIIAVVIGFVGVLLVVSPTDGQFSFYIILPLIGALLNAWRDIELRRLTSYATTNSILVFTQLFIIAAFSIPAAIAWESITMNTLVLLAVASVGFSSGIYLTVESLRDNEASFVIPYKYSGVIWSLMAGAAVWRDIPTPYQLAGVALVVANGVYLNNKA